VVEQVVPANGCPIRATEDIERSIAEDTNV
jgi:hypothetical protein